KTGVAEYYNCKNNNV
ncbi:hypothetical protein CP8484711_0410B, partial [Chlamydia psittaci 84-8471/1]